MDQEHYENNLQVVGSRISIETPPVSPVLDAKRRRQINYRKQNQADSSTIRISNDTDTVITINVPTLKRTAPLRDASADTKIRPRSKSANSVPEREQCPRFKRPDSPWQTQSLTNLSLFEPHQDCIAEEDSDSD